MTAYEFDTTLDPEYPVLTRGNAGEIMPDIVSPLSATVFFPPLERAWGRIACIDKQFREWGQQYFANNPSEGKQVRLNAETVPA